MANATQPASNKGAVTAAPNIFGAPPNNANRQALNHNNWFQTQDATAGTNQVSPLTLSASSVNTIVVPNNAVTITLISSATVNVSEVSGTSSLSQYFALPAGVPVTLDVARLQNIYVIAPTGTPTLSFFFQTL